MSRTAASKTSRATKRVTETAVRGRPRKPEEELLVGQNYRFKISQFQKLALLGGPDDPRGQKWLRKVIDAAELPRAKRASRRVA